MQHFTEAANDDASSLYRAYMLRLWRDDCDAPWRASLECPGGEATYRFGVVEEMIAFLLAQLDAPDPVCTDPTQSP
ncbi:MAG: hypothetical protein WKH64_06500 [Chloroflexia bacterium]